MKIGMVWRKMILAMIIIFTFFTIRHKKILALKNFAEYSKLQGVKKKIVNKKKFLKTLTLVVYCNRYL